MENFLKYLEENAKLTPEQLATMCKKEAGDIQKMIAQCENDGVILGYQTIVNWEKTDREYVTALIELKVTPQRDRGFDSVAEMIYRYPEVKTLYLMSGAYDLCVILEGKTMREVALFVAEKLAVIDGVMGTTTHFVLRKYKDEGVFYKFEEKDERGYTL